MKKLLGVGLLFAAIAGGTAAVLAIKNKKDNQKDDNVETIDVLEEETLEVVDDASVDSRDEFDKLCEESENKTENNK